MLETSSKPVPPVLKKPTVYRRILPKGGIPEEKNVSETLITLWKDSKRRSSYHLKQKCVNSFRKPVPYVEYNSLIKDLKFLTKYFPHQKLNFNSDSFYNMTSLSMLSSLPSLDTMTDGVEECALMSLVKEEIKQEPNHSDKEQTNEIPKRETLDDINAIPVTSTTVKNSRKEQPLVDKKKAKKRKEFLASIAMLAPPNPETEKERRLNFSIAYMNKLQETLGNNEFGRIMKIFVNEKISNAVDLYKKLKPILVPKHQDLADEFLLFLTAEQASAVGQLIPFFIMNHMAKFLRYLEHYFKDQPAQLKRVHKSLQDLNDTPEVNLERIKNVILPLLKSNPLLCDSFLHIFLEESPTATLLNGAWDVIEVNKELNRAKEEGAFENLAVTDEDPACTCGCHKQIGDQVQKHHCDKCGLKFIQGKIYCQTSKGMKPVNVSFPLDPDVDHIARLTVPSKIRRIDQNSNKSSSPCKQVLKDSQTYIELEHGRKRKVRLCESNKKSTPKKKISHSEDKSGENPKGNEDKVVCNKSPTRRRLANLKIINESNIETQNKTVPVTEVDWKNMPSPEYMSIPLSDTDSSQEEEKPFNAMDEEITICKEEITITEETIKKEPTNEDISHNWTKDEDRILLETYKQNFHRDPINLIKHRLKNRSEEEIRSRFDNLMNLLQEMYLRGDSQISNP